MRRSVSVQVAVGSVIVVVVVIREIVSRKGAKVKARRKDEEQDFATFASLREIFLVPKQTIHVLLRIKDDQIVDLFPNSRITNRQV